VKRPAPLGIDPAARACRMAQACARRRKRAGPQLEIDFNAASAKENARRAPGADQSTTERQSTQ